MSPATLKEAIRDVPDFPKKGIVFKDITPLLKDPATFRKSMDFLIEKFSNKQIDYIIGIESRGFIFGPVIAYQLGIGFIPVRKKGKLPAETEEISYSLEYGEAVLEIHQDSIEKGARVAIVDDLLATGGTTLATAQLVEKLGGSVEAIGFLVELEFLNGREKLSAYETHSIIQY